MTQRTIASGFPGCRVSAWAEMLARVAHSNHRLEAAVRRAPRNAHAARRRRGALIEELERERARIARELHAGAGQPLAGISFNLDLIEKCAADLPEDARNALSRLRRLSDAALGQLRAVSHRLHPPDWQELSIEAALKSLVAQTGLSDGWETVVEIAPLPAEPPHEIKVTLYRCAQECISNVLRHSGANRFEIRLTTRGRWLTMRISDNGKGFPKGAVTREGIGLLAIREHARSVDGEVRIDSDALGTTMTVAVPYLED